LKLKSVTPLKHKSPPNAVTCWLLLQPVAEYPYTWHACPDHERRCTSLACPSPPMKEMHWFCPGLGQLQPGVPAQPLPALVQAERVPLARLRLRVEMLGGL
jgi:hypothetical protein